MNKIAAQISQRHRKFEGNATISFIACSCGNAAELVIDSEMRDIVKRLIRLPLTVQQQTVSMAYHIRFR